MTATRFNGSTWNTANLLGTVAWEPYGGLRSYKALPPDGGTTPLAVVDYRAGVTTDAVMASCPSSPDAGANDGSGQVRQLTVTSGSGSALMAQQYQWSGGQLVGEGTCFTGLGQTTAQTKKFFYNGALQLVGVDGGTQPVQTAPTAATFGRSYGFDGRGNRNAATIDGCPRNFSYSGDELNYQVPSTAAGCNTSFNGPSLWFDSDGRTTSTAVGWWWWGLTFDYSAAGMQAAVEGVYRSVSVTGGAGVWAGNNQYYYDAQGRRRYKAFAVVGLSDEFFYDLGHSMLEDTMSDSGTANGSYTTDDFVWLGGRPVAMLRGSATYSAGVAWARRADTTATCNRLGEMTGTTGACGTYFIVNDYLPKPVMLVDTAGRITGTGTYDESGHVNRVPLIVQKAASFIGTVGTAKLPTSGSVVGRALYGYADYQSCGVMNVNNQLEWDSATHVAHRFGRQVARNGSGFTITRVAGTGTCTGNGIDVQAVEYIQYQSGATPTWVPFRFPGQYYDRETDLFENWNRYYFPDTGRYLSPEPMLLDPNWQKGEAKSGHAIPVYAYARNNPIKNSDPTGLYAYGVQCDDPTAGPNKDGFFGYDAPGSNNNQCKDCRKVTADVEEFCKLAGEDDTSCICFRKLQGQVCGGVPKCCKKPKAPAGCGGKEEPKAPASRPQPVAECD